MDVTGARYAYDTYANVTYQAFTWQNRYSDANTVFAYDDQNRVTVAYGQGFGWQPWGSLTSVGGDTYGYAAGHPHAVDLVNGADRYDYDANGSMVVRSKGVSGQEQALRWDANNRLAQVVSSSGVTETYLYDEHGQRIRRQAVYSSTVGDTVTYVPFVFYEQAVSAGGSVVTRHYSLNGERVAVRVGGALSYLYHDQVGSTILTTDASSNVVGSRGYYAFGATRRSSGLTPTDRRFTGQVEDGSGLYYYNSRYYDPQLGQFLSPDTIVPEPTNLLSYNRYLYAKGNPVKFNDPSGHDPLDTMWQQEFKARHGREPSAEDTAIRLYSVAFPDNWNWSDFYNEDGSYIDGSIQDVFGPASPLTWDDVPSALASLAGWYQEDENMEFVRDVGVLFGGLFNRTEAPDTWQAVTGEGAPTYPARQWVYVRPGNMHPDFLGSDSDSNIHHWAWGIVLGSSKLGFVGEMINETREKQQLFAGGNWGSESLRNYQADVSIGNAGVQLGRGWSQRSMRSIVHGLYQDLELAFLTNH